MKRSYLSKSEGRGIVILAILLTLFLAGFALYDRSLALRYASMPSPTVTYAPADTAKAPADTTSRPAKKTHRPKKSRHTTPPPAYRTDRLSEQAD